MKTTLSLLSLIFLSTLSFGQVDTIDTDQTILFQIGNDFDDALFYKKDNSKEFTGQSAEEYLGDRKPINGIIVNYYYGTKNVMWAMECIDGKTTTWIRTYHKNGQISSESLFDKNGMKSGDSKEWDENGNLIASGKYKNGEKHGKWEIWDETGELKSIEKYKMGKLNGA